MDITQLTMVAYIFIYKLDSNKITAFGIKQSMSMQMPKLQSLSLS